MTLSPYLQAAYNRLSEQWQTKEQIGVRIDRLERLIRYGAVEVRTEPAGRFEKDRILYRRKGV